MNEIRYLLENISFPGVISILKWDFLRQLRGSWKFVMEFLALLTLIVITHVLIPMLGVEYIGQVVAGIVSVFLLHPMYSAGTVLVEARTFPGRWRFVPESLGTFALVGLIPRFIVNVLWGVIFLGSFGLTEVNPTFVFSVQYWGLWLLLVPFAFGWGLLSQGISLKLNAGPVVSRAARRLSEGLGCVFFNAKALPTYLYGFHFFFPHSYLSEWARMGLEEHSKWYYLGGVTWGIVFMFLAGYLFLRALDEYRRTGRLGRMV
ncbi:MAG: hypothetical protein ABEJ65_12830 [bacterium]